MSCAFLSIGFLALIASGLRNRAKKRAKTPLDLSKYRPSKFSKLIERLPQFARWCITRLHFLPSILTSIFKHCTYPPGMYDWWNRIDHHLILGAVPWHGCMPRLYLEEGVRGVVNTLEEYSGPVASYASYGIEQLYIPATDFMAPTNSQINEAVEFIEIYQKSGKTVYLHCKAGKGRSTTVAVCYLMKTYHVSGQEALQRIIKCRPQVSRYVWQRPCVLEFARQHGIQTEMEGKSKIMDGMETTNVGCLLEDEQTIG